MAVMNFGEPYLLAMREQVPQMYMELRRHGRLDQHLKQKSLEAQAMFNGLLARHKNPGPAERQQAEEIVRTTLIEFPPEKPPQDNQEPPEDLPGQSESGRKPGEYQALMSSLQNVKRQEVETRNQDDIGSAGTEDVPDEPNEGTFPLDPEGDPIGELSWLIRQHLPTQTAANIYRLSICILALERLPKNTPNVDFTITIDLRDYDAEIHGGITCRWVNLQITETWIKLGEGFHNYDPKVGGDTESSEMFSCSIDGYRKGDFDNWLDEARALLSRGSDISIEGDELPDDFPWDDLE